jgi:hypothetical protein
MRLFYHGPGYGYSVTVLAQEVYNFTRQWPGSILPDRAITFSFDSCGDLIDVTPYDLTPQESDGPDLLALSQDASAYAAKRTKRPELARR